MGLKKKWLTSQPVDQSTNSEKVDESRFRSRIERRMKGVRFPVQDLEKWELWCTIQRVDFQDFATAACQRAFAELTGRLVDQSTTINDLEDQRSNDDEESNATASSSLFSDAGQPVDQATEMLQFYAEKTGNRVRAGDREAYFKGNKALPGVADLPAHAIKMGVMQSVLLCKGRVNSFSYCLGAIFEAHEAGVTTEMVEYLQRTFAARLELRANPTMEHSAYFEKLRQIASQGQQPTLPGAGATLSSIRKGNS